MECDNSGELEKLNKVAFKSREIDHICAPFRPCLDERFNFESACEQERRPK